MNEGHPEPTAIVLPDRTARLPKQAARTAKRTGERVSGATAGGWSARFGRRLFVLAVAALSAVAGWLSFWLCRFTVDDAFITWRYGRTLARSGYWNWNSTGSPRVEAYTNPTYAFTSIVPAVLGIPTEAFFKALGLMLLVTAVVIALRLGDLARPQRLLLAGMVAVNPVFVSHLYSGLETGSFVLLMALLYGRMCRCGHLGRLGYAAAILVALSRPEGMLYAAAALAWNVTRNRSQTRGTVLTLAGLGGYWLVRAWYFRNLLPNTYYVKSGNVGLAGLEHQAKTVLLPTLALVAGCLLVAWPAGQVIRRVARRATGPVPERADRSANQQATPRQDRLQDGVPLLLAALTCGVTLVFYPLSHLIMDIDNRFHWQLTAPIALVLLCRPLSAWTDRRLVAAALALTGVTVFEFRNQQLGIDPHLVQWCALAAVAAAVVMWVRCFPLAVALGAAATMVAVSAIPMATLVNDIAYRTNLGAVHGELGRLLAQDRSIKGLVGIGDAGILPFSLRDDQRAIDFDGLADPYLRKPGGGIPENVWAAQGVAAVVVADSPIYGKASLIDASEGTVVHYALAHHWRFVPGFRYQPGYWMNVYLKPGVGDQFAEAVTARRAAVERATAPTLYGGWTYAHAHTWDFPFLDDRR